MMDVETTAAEIGLRGVEDMAALIRDNKHLRVFLRAIEVSKRFDLYQMMKPHLKFKACPYWMITK